MGQGLRRSPVEGARSPRSSGRWTLNDDGEEGGIPRSPQSRAVPNTVALSTPLLLSVTTSRAVSGRKMKVQASAYCFSQLSAKFPSLMALSSLRVPPIRSFLGLWLYPSCLWPEGLSGEKEKPWMHPQRAEAGLHTIVLGTAPGLRQSRQSARALSDQESGGKKTALRRAISIPFKPCLCWARFSSGSGSNVSCQRGQTVGDPSEQRMSGARGPHTRSLLSGRIYPGKFAEGALSTG